VKKKTEERDGIFKHPGDITVLGLNDKQTVTLITHTTQMTCMFAGVMCNLRTSIWEMFEVV
jgi:hypothetical protein